MSEPGPAAQLLGKVVFEFWKIAPYLPTYTHLILAALFPIYTGAHASLSRPSSAAEPKKKMKKGAVDGGTSDDDDDEDGEDEDQDANGTMEGLSPLDAIMFPLLAGTTLAGLYFLLKWLGNADILNTILTWYFSVLGIFSVGKFLSDTFGVLISFIFPTRWSDGKALWRFKNARKRAESVFPRIDASAESSGSGTRFYRTRASPLPGFISEMPLPQRLFNALWTARIILTEKWSLLARWHGKVVARKRFGINDVAGFVIAFISVGAYSLVSKTWWLTNLMGFGFSYGALQLISPTTFWTGTMVLMALFFYDIYFVFFTPLMVTVAKSLDIPIKLLFPRPQSRGADPKEQSLAMLGLGDVVLPGIMIGLALRFDLYMFYLEKQAKKTSEEASKSENLGSETGGKKPEMASDVVKPKYYSANGGWGERFWTRAHLTLPNTDHVEGGRFPTPYFNASLVGYVIGMLITLGVMHFANHAQPALLYLVPGVLISLWGTALVRGEASIMWAFSEADGDDEDSKGDSPSSKETNKSTTDSVGAGKTERADVKGVPGNTKATSSSRDREVLSISLVGPSLPSSPVIPEAPPAATTLEDALREASEHQLGDSTAAPITAHDFILPHVHRFTAASVVRRTTVDIPEPVEKRRKI